MSKTKKIFGCILVTLVIWAISRFVPGCVSVIDPSSVGLRVFVFAAMLPIGWIIVDKISKGRFSGCIRVNLYIFAFIEAIGILQNISYILQNWSYTGQYTMDMHGIYYSDYPVIFGSAILFSVVYIALCIYLPTKTTVLTDGKTIPAINAEISTAPMSTVEVEPREPLEAPTKEVLLDFPHVVNFGENQIPQSSTEPEKVSEQPKYIAPKKSKQRYCKYCGGAIESEEKKCTRCGKQYFKLKLPRKAFGYRITIFALVVLLGANIIQFIQQREQIKELETTINEQQRNLDGKVDIIRSYIQQVDKLEKENSELAAKSAFFDKYVVLVINDGTNKYHKYDCSKVLKSAGEIWWQETKSGVEYTFWIYILNTAKSLGYSPCTECCN